MRLVFDDFELDTDGGTLLRQGRAMALERRTLDLLCYLAARPGRLISKEELVRDVWRLRQLSPGVLANTVGKLRKALGQTAQERAPIETIHGRGYRFHGVLRSRMEPHVSTVPAHDERGDGALPSSAVVATSRTLLPREDPFVGRTRVMEILGVLLERAERGEGKLVVITGEAGIGKTRVLGELARRARERGFGVWEGAAYDDTGAPPYWPWVVLLRAARADMSKEDWSACLPSESSALAWLVPELFSTAPASFAPADHQAQRFQLFDQLTRLVGASSASTPKLLVLDDLQLTDAATVELLGHAARALSRHRVLLAATVRDGPPSSDESLLASIGRLSRFARLIPLRGLASAEIAELLCARHGSAAHDVRAAEALFERTRGNPFFVRQLLELLTQRGEPLTFANLGTLELPPAVRDVARQRVALLPPETRAQLEVASVVGHEFHAGLLAELLDLTLEQTLVALEPARRLGLIERCPSRSGQLVFVHALIREALYDELSLLARGTLHARLVLALQQNAHTPALDRRLLAEIARHALSALPCELASCLAHCARASAAARAASGFEAAANISARALQRLHAEGGHEAEGCALSLELGVDQYYAGDIESAWATLERGAALSRQLHEPELASRFAFRLLDCVEAGAGDERVARAQVEHALRAVGDASPNLRAALLAHRAEMALELPIQERFVLLDEADRLSLAGPPELLLEIANCRASVRHPAQLEHSRAAAIRLRVLADAQAESGGVRVEIRRFSAELTDYVCALTEADLVAADTSARRAQQLAAGASPVAVRLTAQLMLAGRALADGRLDEHEQRITQLRELCEGVTGGLGSAWMYHLTLLAEARNGWATLGPTLRSIALPELAIAPSSRHTARAFIAFAWLATHIGEHERARYALAQLAADELARMPVSYGDLGTLCQLAETYCALDDSHGARRLYEQLAPFVARNAVGPCLEYHGAVAHYLGLLAAKLGQTELAAQHFMAGLRLNERLGMPLHTARSRERCEQGGTSA